MLTSLRFVHRSWPRSIAINVAAFLLLLVSALSYPLPPGTVTFAGAEAGVIAADTCLQNFTARDGLSIRSLFFCSAHPISHRAIVIDAALEGPPTRISSLVRRETPDLALPATASLSAATAAPSPRGPVRLTGPAWFAAGLLAIVLILLTGLLAGLTMGVMSVDMTRLRVWTRTGSKERR